MARVVLVACLALVGMLVLASIGTKANDSGFYEIGDEWVYDLTMETYSVTLTGTITYSVDGVNTEAVAGLTYDVYDFGIDGNFLATGEYLGFPMVDGTSTYTGSYSVDVETLDTIRSDTNFSMSFMWGDGTILIETWEQTITTYSPPGGIGEEPDEMTEGDIWFIMHTTHSETVTYNMYYITTDSDSSTETKTYRYIGRDTITVPAGNFDCVVVQVDDGEGITTRWYCEAVGSDVKSVYESSNMEDTYVLTSYTFTPKDSDSDNLMLYIAVVAAVGAIAVVAVVALMILKKKPSAPQVTPPESESPPGTLGPLDQPPGTSPPPSPIPEKRP